MKCLGVSMLVFLQPACPVWGLWALSHEIKAKKLLIRAEGGFYPTVDTGHYSLLWLW